MLWFFESRLECCTFDNEGNPFPEPVLFFFVGFPNKFDDFDLS
jgi:hypothetical protein